MALPAAHDLVALDAVALIDDDAARPRREPQLRAARSVDQERLLGLYRTMLLIRTVELEIESAHRQSRMSGSFHSSLGHEASAAGVCAALRPTDIVTSTHRGHGHAIAKGVPIEGVLAELLGRVTGVSGGRGGSMHLHHRQSGFYGENAIVAGGLAWAAGAAWARRRRGAADVAVAFLGDGGFAQGVTHETLLLARHWSSPCLFVCENNGFAHSMPAEHLFGPPGSIAELAGATGVESVYVDGRDVLDVADAAERLVGSIRTSGKPAFLECGVFRVRPHSISDAEYRYRPREAGDEWLAAHDPLEKVRQRLGSTQVEALADIDEEVAATVTNAMATAEAAEKTPTSFAETFVYTTDELANRGRA